MKDNEEPFNVATTCPVPGGASTEIVSADEVPTTLSVPEPFTDAKGPPAGVERVNESNWATVPAELTPEKDQARC